MKNISKEVEQAGLILRNVKQPRVKAAMAAYGYTPARYEEGQSLLNQLLMLEQVKKDEYRAKEQIARNLLDNEREMHQRFLEHRTLAKWIFRQDVDNYRRLELFRPIAGQQATKISQIQQFYREVLKSPSLFTRHGLPKAELEQAQSMIEAIVEARRERQQKAGEAQHATQQRDEARRALRTWVSDFRTVARVALREEPQLLEVLGMMVTA